MSLEDFVFVTLVLCGLFSQTTVAEEDELPWYVEGQFTNYTSRNSSTDSIIANDVLVQYSGESDLGFYFSSYYDKDFWNYFAGGTTTIVDLEVGLGIGESNYDNKDLFTINPWFYYESDELSIEGNIEYTPDETKGDRLFYKGNFDYWLSERVYAGIYAERWVGIGPKLGFSVTENLQAEFVTIVLDRGFSSFLLRLKFVL